MTSTFYFITFVCCPDAASSIALEDFSVRLKETTSCLGEWQNTECVPLIDVVAVTSNLSSFGEVVDEVEACCPVQPSRWPELVSLDPNGLPLFLAGVADIDESYRHVLIVGLQSEIELFLFGKVNDTLRVPFACVAVKAAGWEGFPHRAFQFVSSPLLPDVTVAL